MNMIKIRRSVTVVYEVPLGDYATLEGKPVTLEEAVTYERELVGEARWGAFASAIENHPDPESLPWTVTVDTHEIEWL